ncbi:MAG: SurA N-terminal domain-containing protein, partial [Chloroflexota bacterium]
MIQIPRSFMMLPVAAICVALAGCGSPSANKPIASSTTPSTTPGTPVTVPTQAVLPTPVIVGSPAAIVNGHAIPISTYRLFLNLAQKSSGNTPGITTKQLAKQVMDEVIFNEIVRQYAVSHKISATQKDVAAQIKTAETQTGGAQKFEKQLAQYGLTLSTYEQLVQPNLLAQKVEAVVSPIPPARSDASAKARAENVLSQLK